VSGRDSLLGGVGGNEQKMPGDGFVLYWNCEAQKRKMIRGRSKTEFSISQFSVLTSLTAETVLVGVATSHFRYGFEMVMTRGNAKLLLTVPVLYVARTARRTTQDGGCCVLTACLPPRVFLHRIILFYFI